MIPIDTVDSTPIHILSILGMALLLGTFAIGMIFPKTLSGPLSILIILGMLGGAGIGIVGAYNQENDKNKTITSWVEKRYGIQIPENQQSGLIGKEIITLDDGTEVQLELPSKDAEGYLLYNIAERNELPVK
jgi:hypothetical protein